MDPAQAQQRFQRGEALEKEKRFRDAMVEFRAAAKLGHGAAMTRIGLAHVFGHGVPKSAAKAHEWFKKSAATGDAEGLRNLALDFRDGVPEAGVARDRAEGLRFMRMAGEAGLAKAMFNVGVWIGEDDSADPEQIVWLKRAIDAGSVEAINTLGACYKNGIGGLEKNVEAAIALYRQAAEKGDSTAMYNLGANHYHGTGVEHDLTKAAEWYERAMIAGHDGAAGALMDVKRTLADLKVSAPCSACGRPATNRCSGCMLDTYCSVDCQRAHWQTHKAECKAKRADADKKKAGRTTLELCLVLEKKND